MTATDATVVPMVRARRPAVHASTLVRSDLNHTFDAFVRTIGAWWPVGRISAGRDRVRDVTIEPMNGGRVYETWDDQTTREWGQVLAWDPPNGFTLTWNVTAAPTEVELLFTALSPELTRVTVEHRGWEAFTEEQLNEDCASPGGYGAGSYDDGWRLVLDSFGASVQPASDFNTIEVTDEFMLEMRARTKAYTFMLLSQGPNWNTPERDKIIWEHGRRNHALRLSGSLSIVCPVLDDSPRCGVGLFNATLDQTEAIIKDDPGVRAGIFEFELHPVRSFPGDKLPL